MLHTLGWVFRPGSEVVDVGPGRDLVRDGPCSLEPKSHDQGQPVSGCRTARGQPTGGSFLISHKPIEANPFGLAIGSDLQMLTRMSGFENAPV
eukprot:5270281-Heterocapsa_arctica.AAC.1